MGVRNYLIEGVSGTGKTSVCDELLRRGFNAVHGDRVLALQGDPETGAALTTGQLPAMPSPAFLHEHHIWDLAKVEALSADTSQGHTFFCGGSRNFAKFLDRFDEVFVLAVDAVTLTARLDARP